MSIMMEQKDWPNIMTMQQGSNRYGISISLFFSQFIHSDYIQILVSLLEASIMDSQMEVLLFLFLEVVSQSWKVKY